MNSNDIVSATAAANLEIPATTDRSKNFTAENVLASIHHPYTINSKSLYSYYFYTNTNTVLSKFAMSYEEQLHKAIDKNNYELCHELVVNKHCDVNKAHNRKYPLCLACEANSLEIAELLVKNGANVNQFDHYDQSCLIYAVGVADLSIVQLLVENGADVNKADSNGLTPLHVAIMRHNDEISEFLLKCGADINLTDKLKNSPLSIAISNEYMSMVDKLLSLGVNVNSPDENGDTPLIKAIWMSMSSNVPQTQVNALVRHLMSMGADIDASNNTGRTALFTAIYQNNTDAALYLIEAGANCEDFLMSNLTLLHYACFQGNLTLCRALLARGCDPNSVANACESPVYIAVIKGYLDILSLLVEHGANVNLVVGAECDSKCTALQASIYYLSDYELFKKIVNKLIEGNVNLNICQPGPILYICLQYNKANCAKYLVSVGSSVEQRTVFNQSPFYKAFLNKNLDFMEICVMAGFRLRDEAWINEYLGNPDFIEYTDYYVRKANETEASEETAALAENAAESIESRSDQQINDMLNADEYYFERFHLSGNKKRDPDSERKRSAELAKKIYTFIKYHYKNPLTLKEIARIKIRQHLLAIDHRLKPKVERQLSSLPNQLKDFLLMKEFHL